MADSQPIRSKVSPISTVLYSPPKRPQRPAVTRGARLPLETATKAGAVQRPPRENSAGAIPLSLIQCHTPAATEPLATVIALASVGRHKIRRRPLVGRSVRRRSSPAVPYLLESLQARFEQSVLMQSGAGWYGRVQRHRPSAGRSSVSPSLSCRSSSAANQLQRSVPVGAVHARVTWQGLALLSPTVLRIATVALEVAVQKAGLWWMCCLLLWRLLSWMFT